MELQQAADYLADVCEIARIDVKVDRQLMALCGGAMGVTLAARYTEIERYHCCMAALRDFTTALSAGGR